jgi:TM2 domain-containing membrane protein YozV
MGLTTAQLSLIEQRVTNDGPSAGVAFLFWLFLGLLGGHRFYLGRPGSAIAQIITVMMVFGILWWLIDIVLLGGMIQSRRSEIRQRLTMDMLAHSAGATQPATAAPTALVA